MNRKILAIEDDRDALANLCDILELDGFDVTGIGTLAEAPAHGKWADYAVVLLDRRLPDGTADDVLPRIRAAAPRTAVIVITGYADLEGTITALRDGATDYLIKPVNADLLRATIQRAVHLQDMEDKLIQTERLAAIGQMITVLTHESGNILARGHAVLEMLEMEIESTPSALQLIERLKKAYGDLQRLYEEVRNYAAPIKLECDRWDLGSIWRQTWKNLTNDKKFEHPPTLSEKIRGVDLKCEADGFRLDQVFRNLFENAIAACPHQAQIEIECSETDLADQPALRIIVRDNGPGLTPEQAQRVFAPFYTTKPKGTGLGLAIVTRIVEAHGGRITALGTAPSAGASFIMTLPRRVSKIDGAPADTSSTTSPLAVGNL